MSAHAFGHRPGEAVVLLLGATGQVGTELRRALAPLGRLVLPARADAELTDPDALRRLVRDTRPDAIVNAAAHTAVDRAEAERDLAFAINATAPGVLAEEAARIDAAIVHYSTDYVFDGAADRPYGEDATATPLNVYGASKLAGEQAVLGSGARALVLRTSWIYGAHGRNFLATMLRIAEAGDRPVVRVVDDQRGTPTASAFVADATATMLTGAPEREAWGLYHVTAGGSATWRDFASAIFAGAARRGLHVPAVERIGTAEFGAPARRPAYSVLDTSRARQVFGIAAAPWESQLEAVLDARIGAVPSLPTEST
ncbi:MAG: dTDP-4-dehydrorhamnose reductase [Gemmatirosa sp.]